MYKLTDTFVLILLIFAVFLSVAYTTLNKLFAVFFIYYVKNIGQVSPSAGKRTYLTYFRNRYIVHWCQPESKS